MTLRVRLLLGYGYLVALVLVAAGSALAGFLQLSAGIGVVLEENVKSIGAAMRMIESLERQDSATLAALLEGRPTGDEMAEHEATFEDALAIALDNVTEPEEPEILNALERDYRAYRRAREALLAERPELPVTAYERTVAPHFAAVKLGVVRLLDVNHGAMVEADQRSRRTALANGAWLGALVAVSLLSFVLLSRAMQRHVLTRLEHLRRGSEAVVEGDTRRRLLEHDDDELGRVAAAVDRLLDRLQQSEGRLGAAVRRERRLALALLASHGPKAALFDLDGRLLAGEPGAGVEEAMRGWAADEGRRLAAEMADGEGDDGAARLEGDLDVTPLSVAAGGTLGWLVRPHRS